jgi:hypothetical protein
MRLVIAAVIFVILLPGIAKASTAKSACKTRGSQMYKFCMNNARSSEAKKACKVDHKRNKSMCK